MSSCEKAAVIEVCSIWVTWSASSVQEKQCIAKRPLRYSVPHATKVFYLHHRHQVMNKWAVMDVDDALELLDKTFTNSAVRMHAVKCLDAADDDTLILYLLQLVQALKYEPLLSADGQDMSNLPPPTTKQDDVEDPPPGGRGPDGGPDGGPGAVSRPPPPAKIEFAPLSLAGFLTRRALSNRQLGSFFYWYLLVECKDKNKAIARLYVRVWTNFEAELETGTPEQRALKVGGGGFGGGGLVVVWWWSSDGLAGTPRECALPHVLRRLTMASIYTKSNAPWYCFSNVYIF